MNYVKGLDTVRALAVLLVIVFHWGPFFDPGTVPNKIMREVIPNGEFGVTLFFVLSGFLITSILLKERVKNQIEGGGKMHIIKNFFVRRSLRIFPIYYLMILVLYLAQQPYLRQHLGWFLTYTGNFLPFIENKPNSIGHTWSLAVEEQFYLVWPWIILFVKDRHLKKVFTIAIVIGIVSKYFVWYVLHREYATLVVNWFDAFGIGGGYAYLRMDTEKYRRFDRKFLMAMVILLFVSWRLMPISGLPILTLCLRELEMLVALGMIIFVLNNKSVWINNYILENRVFNYIGRISYGLYLYHYVLEGPVWRVIHQWWDNNPGLPGWMRNYYFGYVACYVVLFVVCAISYRWIERPLLTLKKYFNYS